MAWFCLLLSAKVCSEPVTFHCYPPGAKVYLRGSVEQYVGLAGQPVELPLGNGVSFCEVELRHPDGEHYAKIERPIPGHPRWPEQGQLVLQPHSVLVRVKDWFRYPTFASSAGCLLFLGTLVGVGLHTWKSRKAQRGAHLAQRRAEESKRQMEQSRLLQQKAEAEARQRAEAARLAKVAQERERLEAQQAKETLEKRHQVLDAALDADPWVGSRAGSYVLTQLLGKGASGRVYQGELVGAHPTAPSKVAVKVIELTSEHPVEMQQRFLNEMEVGKSLQHPHIVAYYGANQSEKAIFIFQELIPGGRTLNSLNSQAPLPLDQVLKWLRPVAQALDYMHSKSVFHRDLKPENVMLTEDGIPKIADLGLAKNPDHLVTKTFEGYGTPAYIAPEQIKDFRTVDGRTDQYALGCMAYHWLAGQLPFPGPPDQVLVAHLMQEAPPIPDQSASINAVLLKMLHKDREQRFPNCTQALLALERAGRGSEES